MVEARRAPSFFLPFRQISNNNDDGGLSPSTVLRSDTVWSSSCGWSHSVLTTMLPRECYRLRSKRICSRLYAYQWWGRNVDPNRTAWLLHLTPGEGMLAGASSAVCAHKRLWLCVCSGLCWRVRHIPLILVILPGPHLLSIFLFFRRSSGHLLGLSKILSSSLEMI